MSTVAESHRNESGLTPIEEVRLAARAAGRRGWIHGRFPTREAKEDIEQRLADPAKATAIDKAVKVAHDAMDSSKMAARLRGGNLVRLMEMSNQRDDLGDDPFVDGGGGSITPAVHNTQIIFNMPNNGRGPAALDEPTNGDD